MRRIVVGVDGSEHAQRALEWAAEEALAYGAKLVAAYVYEDNPSWLAYASDESLRAEEVEALRRSMQESGEEARKQAEGVVGRMLLEAKTGGRISTETLVIEGRHPARELVELSADADLLVVGSRGRGGFSGLLLGSVSQQCAAHARCPVTIIRPRQA
jgi:nucleotide-binding universal stress UspA family protein